jgi:hypothetical protein
MRRLAWVATLALVVLGGRALAYALSPSPLAADFSQRVGGPTLPMVAAVSVGLALLCASALVALVALAVRERLVLEPRQVSFEPRLHLLRLVGRALALWLVAMPAFALLESYIHWRAGLGWHGLHCLVGPAHQDAIPLLGALSLVGAALAAAVEHVLAWMRRTAASLSRAAIVGVPAPAYAPTYSFVPSSISGHAALARGPPPRS